MMKKNLVYLLIILIFNSLSAQKIVKLEKTQFWIYGGEIHRVENFPSQHVAQRNVDIWLPNNYNDFIFLNHSSNRTFLLEQIN